MPPSRRLPLLPLLALVLATVGCGPLADHLVEEARTAEATGRASDAERSLSLALTLDPDHLRGRVELDGKAVVYRCYPPEAAALTA